MQAAHAEQISSDDIVTDDRNYYRHTAPPDVMPPLTRDVTADVAVVGGGFSGLATAYYLSRRHALNVVLLERHYAGWGASGRNGGQILPGLMAPLPRLARRYGMDVTKKLWDLSVHGLNAVIDIAATHNIDCELRPGSLHPVRAAHYNRRSLDRIQDLRAQLNAPVILLDETKTQDELHCRPGMYRAALHDRSAWHFHPLKYINGLKTVLRPQVQIFENTEVTAIDNHGPDVTLRTPGGCVRASKIVLCGDSYLGRLVPGLRRKYVLIRNGMIGTAAIPEDISFLPQSGCVSEYGGPLLFYRRTADNRLLLGGGDAVRPGRDLRETEEKTNAVLKQSLYDVFPQLRDYRVPWHWGGYIGITTSYLPYTGSLDGRIYYMGGYSGHGINLSHLLGQLCAAAIARDNPRTDTVFDTIRNLPLPGLGHYDTTLAHLGMALESILERLD